MRTVQRLNKQYSTGDGPRAVARAAARRAGRCPAPTVPTAPSAPADRRVTSRYIQSPAQYITQLRTPAVPTSERANHLSVQL